MSSVCHHQKVLLKGMWDMAACCLKANKQARFVESKVCSFQILATGSGGGGHLSKGRLPPLATSGARAYRQKWRVRGVYAEHTVISDSHLQIGIDGLTSIMLVVLDIVIFNSRIHLFPFLWGQLSELWHLTSWLKSGHHVVNLSTWWGFWYL